MPSSQTAEKLRAALRFLMTSDMASEHKGVLIDVVTQALRDLETSDIQERAAEQANEQWQPSETEQLRNLLQGKVATSWQHADELTMRVAAQLHRPLQQIRAKATELGFAEAVDYRVAKRRALTNPEE